MLRDMNRILARPKSSPLRGNELEFWVILMFRGNLDGIDRNAELLVSII